jgi:hypothetical protein
MTTIIDYQSRVKAGAAFLDEKRPGWAAEIETFRLSLKSLCDCVLGQLYGFYEEAMSVLGLTSDRAIELGFTVEVYNPFSTVSPLEAFAILDQLWTVEIRSRLIQAEPMTTSDDEATTLESADVRELALV